MTLPAGSASTARAAQTTWRSPLLLWIVRTAAWLISLPLYLARVRFLQLSAPGRIGHLASEPDTFVKEGQLGLRPWYYGILISPAGTAANDCLVDYWGRYIGIVRSRAWSRIGWQLQKIPHLRLDLSNAAINQTAPYHYVQRAWGDRPPLLSIDEQHRRAGAEVLQRLGIPAGAEIVCFHAREAGYSPEDDAIHAYRNCSVQNYMLAVEALAARGLWCVRMGHSRSSIAKPPQNVVDYAQSDLRSDWMDVYLCATCKFFLGSSSGLIFLANVFGRPTASANHAPLSSVLAFGVRDIAIPKLLWSRHEKRYLTFPEAFQSDVANYRFTEFYEAQGLRPDENSPEDIRDLALEMLDRCNGRVPHVAEDEDLQQQFRSLMRPGHYSYGGATRLGRDFLRKYKSLLVTGSDQ